MLLFIVQSSGPCAVLGMHLNGMTGPRCRVPQRQAISTAHAVIRLHYALAWSRHVSFASYDHSRREQCCCHAHRGRWRIHSSRTLISTNDTRACLRMLCIYRTTTRSPANTKTCFAAQTTMTSDMLASSATLTTC